MTLKPALQGIRVIDLTRVLAGPFCTMVLADLGAEVIKVERPGTGDDSRSFGPFVDNESAYFTSINRNKKSIALDLKKTEDRELLKKLVCVSDVLVENFRPGTMARLNLDDKVLRVLNPRLIYASCSGFGQTGPYSSKAAYDIIIQAMGGLMGITGQPGGPPTRVGASIADITAGLYTAIAIITALFHREKTGRGQSVDIAMFDSVISILENAFARYMVTGEDPAPLGNRHPSITPFTSLKTLDGYMVVAVGNESLWKTFCSVIQNPHLTEDPRFSSNHHRTVNAVPLEQILNEIFQAKTTQYWLDLLEKGGIPCGPINPISQLAADAQVKARDMMVSMGKGFKITGTPLKMSETPGQVREPAPKLDQHREYVLQEILRLERGEQEL